jgi:aliphatic nitrilase
MISLAKAAADPAGHYARPDVTRLLLDKTPGDRVVPRQRHADEVSRPGDEEPLATRTDASTNPTLRSAA